MRAIRIVFGASIVFAQLGCGVMPSATECQGTVALYPTPAAAALVLLLKAEGADIGEIDVPNLFEAGPQDSAQPPSTRKSGAMTLRVGAGVAAPGSETIGSAPNTTVAAYSDVLTNGPTFEVIAEFGAGKVKVYGEAGHSSFEGQVWTNPDNPADSWLASDRTATSIIGGARFLMGPAYAKAGIGVAMLSEMSRIDNSTGTSHVVFDAASPPAFVIGAGAEVNLRKMRVYADLEWMMTAGGSEAVTEDALLHWPQFEAGTGMSVMTMLVGMSLSF